MWNDIAKSILLLSASGSLITLILVMLKPFVQVKFSKKMVLLYMDYRISKICSTDRITCFGQP